MATTDEELATIARHMRAEWIEAELAFTDELRATLQQDARVRAESISDTLKLETATKDRTPKVPQVVEEGLVETLEAAKSIREEHAALTKAKAALESSLEQAEGREYLATLASLEEHTVRIAELEARFVWAGKDIDAEQARIDLAREDKAIELRRLTEERGPDSLRVKAAAEEAQALEIERIYLDQERQLRLAERMIGQQVEAQAVQRAAEHFALLDFNESREVQALARSQDPQERIDGIRRQAQLQERSVVPVTERDGYAAVLEAMRNERKQSSAGEALSRLMPNTISLREIQSDRLAGAPPQEFTDADISTLGAGISTPEGKQRFDAFVSRLKQQAVQTATVGDGDES